MISALLGKEFGLYSQCNVKSVWGFVQLSDTQRYCFRRLLWLLLAKWFGEGARIKTVICFRDCCSLLGKRWWWFGLAW